MTLPPDPFTVSCFYYNKIPGQYLSFYRSFCNFYYISFPYIWEYLSPIFRYKLYTDKEKTMITYDPLWETLKRKGISQYDLLTKFGMSRGMLDNLKHNRSITITTLDDLCTMLDCDITDILCYKKKKDQKL